MKQIKRQEGFTLIELLMAMAIFSAALLIVTTGFINVVRIHQSGLASRSTQQNARMLLEDVTRTVRNSATVKPVAERIVSGVTVISRVCFQNGSQILVYAVDASGNLRQGTTTNPNCPAPVIGANWRILNDSSVRVTQFVVDSTGRVGPGLGTAMVTMTVASNNNINSLDPATNYTTCRPGPGSQFCAVTTVSSTATLRGGDGL